MEAALKASGIRWPVPSEAVVQRQVVDFFRWLGFMVAATSQYRKSHLMPGLPDLLGWHLAAPLSFAFEVKKPQRKPVSRDPFHPQKPETWSPESLRPAQVKFRDRLLTAGHWYGWGGVWDAHALAATMGLLVEVGTKVYALTDRGRELQRKAMVFLATRTTAARTVRDSGGGLGSLVR